MVLMVALPAVAVLEKTSRGPKALRFVALRFEDFLLQLLVLNFAF